MNRTKTPGVYCESVQPDKAGNMSGPVYTFRLREMEPKEIERRGLTPYLLKEGEHNAPT
ncbi:hypothetical protein [Bhargavaea beijingensis]|uniref:hypothetical protein n=1 Tax=Bhargavaea beijingensis TaxID=426756 RepID=UPI0022252FC6|nr:hypothetical protein [Bhargavaea beijingensis]MCW1926954.1 hypothetical protein [Bhargavaea beijingensis]